MSAEEGEWKDGKTVPSLEERRNLICLVAVEGVAELQATAGDLDIGPFVLQAICAELFHLSSTYDEEMAAAKDTLKFLGSLAGGLMFAHQRQPEGDDDLAKMNQVAWQHGHDLLAATGVRPIGGAA